MKSQTHNSFLGGILAGAGGAATTAATGSMKGVIDSLLGPVTSLFAGLFGNNYQTTTGPRWLAAWYKHYVLGQTCASPTKCVGDADVPPAQAWFTAVTGVPVYDRYRLAALQGWDLQNDRALNNSDSQRVDDYMRLGPLEASVDPAIVMQAVQIAKNLRHHAPEGSWAPYGKPAPVMAPQVSEYLPQTATDTGNGGTGSMQSVKSGYGGWIIAGIAAVVVVVLIVLIARKK
jgi:hypothetical protein